MAAILGIITQVFQYLPMAVTGTRAFIDWIMGIRAAAQQQAQWTPDMEQAFINWLISLAGQSQWQPSPAPTPIAAPALTPPPVVALVGAPSTGEVTTIITSPAPTVITQVPTP